MTDRDLRRLAVATAIGVACFAVSWAATNLIIGFDQDFASSMRATQTLLAHGDPYLTLTPGTSALAGTPTFYYPLPMAFLLAPFSTIPVKIGGPVFAGLTSGLLAFAVTETAWWPLLMFTSASALIAIVAANMSMLLTAAALLPWLEWVAVFKPNIGLAILAYRPSWKAALAMTLIAAATLFVLPAWPREWLSNAAHSRFHFAPWRVPGGILIPVLALTRWRRPEARLLAMMAAVPSSPIVYEALPLFLIPNTPRQMLWLSALSIVAFVVNARHSLLVDPEIFVAIGRWSLLLLIYVPSVVMVLRRPNVGPVPGWLDGALLRLPPWLRGETGAE